MKIDPTAKPMTDERLREIERDRRLIYASHVRRELLAEIYRLRNVVRCMSNSGTMSETGEINFLRIKSDPQPCECLPDTPPDLPVWQRCLCCREKFLVTIIDKFIEREEEVCTTEPKEE